MQYSAVPLLLCKANKLLTPEPETKQLHTRNQHYFMGH